MESKIHIVLAEAEFDRVFSWAKRNALASNHGELDDGREFMYILAIEPLVFVMEQGGTHVKPPKDPKERWDYETSIRRGELPHRRS